MGGGDFNLAGMICIVGFGVVIVVVVVVYIGFYWGGEMIYDGCWGVMEWLICFIIFGVNVLELLVLVFVGLIVWCVWKKM